MLLDLDELAHLSRVLGFQTVRRSKNELCILVRETACLVFRNFPKDNDNAFGFENSEWHSHDALFIVTDDGRSIQFSPAEILTGLKDGSLVVVQGNQDYDHSIMWITTPEGMERDTCSPVID